MTALRVLIVDDEPLARQRLRHLLAEIPETEVVGECGDGTDAARAIADLAPDVVLLDVQMREMEASRSSTPSARAGCLRWSSSPRTTSSPCARSTSVPSITS